MSMLKTACKVVNPKCCRLLPWQLMLLLTLVYLKAVESSASDVSMTSRGHMIFVHTNQSVTLDCQFRADQFSLFDNPVVWKKTQRHEETQINIMSNIVEPFLKTNRLSVSFAVDAPLYRMALRIRGVRPEDCGNYTCEVRGKKSRLLASVTYLLFSIAPVTRIECHQNMTSSDVNINDTSSSSSSLHRMSRDNEQQQQENLVFVESVPSSVICSVHGGYPPPSIRLYVGAVDVTGRFNEPTRLFHVTGDRGLRRVVCHTSVFTNRLALKYSHNRLAFRCDATVPGLPTTSLFVTALVHYAPVISCPRTVAHVNQRNAYIMCEVRAQPDVLVLYWVIDRNGTMLVAGQVIREYWTLVLIYSVLMIVTVHPYSAGAARVQDRNDGVLETRLYMRRASEASFHTYTLVAENAVATTRRKVSLTQSESRLGDVADADVVLADRQWLSIIDDQQASHPRYQQLDDDVIVVVGVDNASFRTSSTYLLLLGHFSAVVLAQRLI